MKQKNMKYPGVDYELIERKSDGLFNYLKPDGSLLSNVWFEKAEPFVYGLAVVKTIPKNLLETKVYNYLKTDGTYLLDEFVRYAESFSCGYGMVYMEKNGEKIYNFIDPSGSYLMEDGFEFAHSFSENFAVVYNKDFGTNYLKKDKSFLLPTWDYICHDFCEGCGMIMKRVHQDQKTDAKCAFVNAKGKIVGKHWFADANEFCEGFVVVKRLTDGMYNYMKPNGTFLLKEWVPYAENFHEGLGIVGIREHAYNYVNPYGSFLLKDWMYHVTTFDHGTALIYQDSMNSYCLIDKLGYEVRD